MTARSHGRAPARRSCCRRAASTTSLDERAPSLMLLTARRPDVTPLTLNDQADRRRRRRPPPPPTLPLVATDHGAAATGGGGCRYVDGQERGGSDDVRRLPVPASMPSCCTWASRCSVPATHSRWRDDESRGPQPVTLIELRESADRSADSRRSTATAAHEGGLVHRGRRRLVIRLSGGRPPRARMSSKRSPKCQR